MGLSQLSQAEGSIGIGSLAFLTGVSVEALRYYEQRGLVQPTGRRRASGYREYSKETVRLARFIKRAQGLGFTLSEVEDLIRLRERAWSGDAPWQLREAAVAKVEDIDRRMCELCALKRALTELVAACDQACPVDGAQDCDPLPCPLIEAFDTDDASRLSGAPSTTIKRRKRR